MNHSSKLYHIDSIESMAEIGQIPVIYSPDFIDQLPTASPINIWPENFITGVFGIISSDAEAQPLICGFADDPATQDYWIPQTMQHGKVPDVINGVNNCYLSMATFKPDPDDGKYRARKKNVVANHAILLDDLGTKSSSDVKLPLSWKIETSPGNFQGGYILDVPCTDLGLYESAVKEMGKQGWSDPGASGAARWGRLPCGVNSKAKYLVEGVAPQVKLVEFHPERRYSLHQIIQAFGLTIGKKESQSATIQGKNAVACVDDPFGECDEGGRTLKTVSAAMIFLRKDYTTSQTTELCMLIDEHKHHPPLEQTHPGKVQKIVLDVYERYIVQEQPDFVIELNVDHFVAREGGKTVVCMEYFDPVLNRIVLVRMSFADFKNYHCNISIWGKDKKGNPTSTPKGQAWLQSRYRRQYIDPEGFWRRLVVVACEDVALGGILETALTMVAAKSKVWRRKNGGDEKVIRYIVPQLSGAVKDRSSCDFMQLLWHHPRKHKDITTLRTASIQMLSEFVLTEKLPTSFRACAAWLLAGTDRFENKQLPLRSGSRETFNATMEQMNVPALIRYIAIRGTVACRYPMALLHPFMWQMQNKSLYVSVERTDFPHKREYIAGLPSETWDQYTREGKQSLAYFGKACKAVDDWLTRRGITGRDARIAAIGAAVYICEGAKLNRRLQFEGLDEITEAVELIDYRNVGLSLNDGRELSQLILENNEILHQSRQKVLAGSESTHTTTFTHKQKPL